MFYSIILDILQCLGVIYFLFIFLFRWIFSTPLLIYLLYTRYYWLTFIYMLWYMFDFETHNRGGRRSNLYRRFIGWCLAPYFPITMKKTADLPPDRNYIFGLHPHGVFCFSHATTFASEALGFSEKFPGLEISLCTLNCYFWLPVHREALLLTGAVPASRQNIDHILSSKKNSGKGVAIVIGGAREMVASHPGTMRLTLRNRKGFIRMALRHGASLVPVISFGENDLYDTIQKNEESNKKFFLRLYFKIQGIFCRVLSFPIMYFRGRGFLPYKRPVTVIIGKPLPAPEPIGMDNEPSKDQLDELHQKYIEELTKLYEEHKAKYGYENVPLILE